MSNQQILFAETIAGMKKAIKRKSYDSDSDSSIEHLTNRGNKLKRKARYVHEGQLAPPSGPLVYRRKINHGGYERDIISRNPPLIDEDGYEFESDDDEERTQAAILAAADLDPYADVKIEELLAPLTAAADLPNHPTLALPFTSNTLNELTRQAEEMVHKEKASLWKIKHLLTRLSGDNTWIPCESVEEENDIDLFFDEWERQHHPLNEKGPSKGEVDQLSTGTIQAEDEVLSKDLSSGIGIAINVPINGTELTNTPIPNDAITPKEDFLTSEAKPDAVTNASSAAKPDGPSEEPIISSSNGTHEGTKPAGVPEIDDQMAIDNDTLDELEAGDAEGIVEDQDNVPVPRRMRTRAQAQAASDNTTSRTRSMTPDSSNENYVHPYFLAPQKSHPDRDAGLPPQEAEETRRLLQLYIQKQEEVCRGAQRVYEGLLRANRLRHLVMKWAKAEAHVGVDRDMSDGEDWYDKEEWGLTEDLKKGQDEEEEDAATTAKKTRTRRQ